MSGLDPFADAARRPAGFSYLLPPTYPPPCIQTRTAAFAVPSALALSNIALGAKTSRNKQSSVSRGLGAGIGSVALSPGALKSVIFEGVPVVVLARAAVDSRPHAGPA